MAVLAIDTVGIVGGGAMGAGIAQACTRAGLRTVLVRGTGGPTDELRASIERSMRRAIERGRMTAEEREFALDHLAIAADDGALARCDLVLECVAEDLEVKRQVYARIARLARADAIWASNTSTLRVAELAAAAGRAGRFVGLHFFNPPQAMKLVELVAPAGTADDAIAAARAFVLRLGKTPVQVADEAGFVVNRLLVPYLLDAVRMVESGRAAVGDIDTAMQLGAGLPIGPLLLADHIGLDVVHAMARLLYVDLQEPRLSPPGLLRKLVLDGALGRKSGRGFYDWSHSPPVPVRGIGPRHLVQSSDRPGITRGALED